jgi:hypothetical protein
MVSTASRIANSSWFLLTALLLALCVLMTGLWLAAEAKGRTQAAYVETTAEWTRFDAPVLETRGRRSDQWVVPVYFTYLVGTNRFSGNDRVVQSIFDRRSPEIGAAFTVWYDPATPSRVVLSRHGPEADAWLASRLALVCGVGALCGGLLGWVRHQRAHGGGGAG